jgi:hypothetical protein
MDNELSQQFFSYLILWVAINKMFIYLFIFTEMDAWIG